MRHSLYWDNFACRIEETVKAISNNEMPKVRRVAVFVTENCNLRCSYCNAKSSPKQMNEETFNDIVVKYGKDAIIHITGGEPSVVPWLYPYLTKHGSEYSFHLNTNMVIPPPAKHIKRLKVSLDSNNPIYWNALVGRDVFHKVVDNIKIACKETVTSVTYTLSKENFRNTIDFIRFAQREFDGLYALFFSIYKGNNARFAFADQDISEFFEDVLPEMKKILEPESLALLNETLNEKLRLIAGVRFPNNCGSEPCYISMSERCFSPDGKKYKCSHMYRDKVFQINYEKHDKCLYGCNQRLVDFNNEVSIRLKK